MLFLRLKRQDFEQDNFIFKNCGKYGLDLNPYLDPEPEREPKLEPKLFQGQKRNRNN